MSTETNDFSMKCISQEAWDAYALARGVYAPYTDQEGNIVIGVAPDWHVDWIGQLDGATGPYYVNARYTGDPSNIAATRRQRRKRLSVFLADEGVEWIPPQSVSAYPRVWAGGMIPYTVEDAIADIRALGSALAITRTNRKKLLKLCEETDHD